MLSLRVYSPALDGQAFLEDVTSAVGDTWRRTIRQQGGYWRGNFTLYGNPQYLSRFFYERLACHFQEKWGGKITWEGLIYEMDLTINGTTRRRSLDLLSNYVTSTYINTSDDVVTSSAAQNAQSVAKYGRKEELLSLDGYYQTAAETYRDTFLTEHQWPWSRTVGVMSGNESELNVVVCGYVFTSNWRYATGGDDSTGNVSDYIDDLISTDCEFLSKGTISSNTLQVKKGQDSPTRTFDVIDELTALGDANGAPWRFHVANSKITSYEIIDPEPSYYLRRGKLYSSAGGSREIIPWLCQPLVCRDMDYPINKYDYSGWFSNIRDFAIEEVDVSINGGLILKTEFFDESEIMAAQQAYTRRSEPSKSSGNADRLNWKRKMNLVEGTPEWEEAVRLGKQAWMEKYKGK